MRILNGFTGLKGTFLINEKQDLMAMVQIPLGPTLKG